jgi:hypothetical protein
MFVFLYYKKSIFCIYLKSGIFKTKECWIRLQRGIMLIHTGIYITNDPNKLFQFSYYEKYHNIL